MRKPATGLLLIVFLLISPPVAADDLYRYTAPNFDGIGKFYMGREISHVMGHQARPGWNGPSASARNGSIS